MFSLEDSKFRYVLRTCQNPLSDVKFSCMPKMTADCHGTIFALWSASCGVFFVVVVVYLTSPNTEGQKECIGSINRFPTAQTIWLVDHWESVKEAD